MPRVTVIPDDNAVYVDGSALSFILPAYDPNWHALQFYPDLGDLLTFECKVGFQDAIQGSAATVLIHPFVSAHAVEVARLATVTAAVTASAVVSGV